MAEVKHHRQPDQQRSAVQLLDVTEEEVGLRLDKFIRDHLPDLPFSAIHRIMRTGQVRVNGGRVKGSRRLAQGDTVRLPPIHADQSPPQQSGVPERLVKEVQKRILHLDRRVLVISKPSGVAVHGGTNQQWGIIDAVAQMPEMADFRPELCHRLDRDTSGALLFGLDSKAVRYLAEQFRSSRIEKEYRVIVKGVPRKTRGLIDQPLNKGVVRGGERMVVAGSGGQAARTRYRVVEKLGNVALVSVRPETGRTHQIRVHMQWIGHPVAGDGKYGDRKFNGNMKKFGLKRLFLHAASLGFNHPDGKKPMTVKAPLDTELKSVIDRLRNGNDSGEITREPSNKRRRGR
ncbi:MAG: RluA family pseudouridine synthase [Magnetococcales bacterium]|nr:RluA family pseudouridine synthase [Magnetococcales bacterium]